MAYTAATAAILKAAFTRFAAVADATIEYWIARAQRSVDSTWTEDDRQMGEMLLACHLMILNGYGTGAEAEAAAQGAGEYKTIRSASVTLERFDQQGSAAGTVGSTSYGRQYLELTRQNRGGPRVMATGSLPTSAPESA